MYSVKNGIMYKNGKPVFGIGTSYYASFNTEKFCVPPDGDRFGQALLDIEDMEKAGYNHVRLAAIGNTRLEDGKVVVDTPFIDFLVKELSKHNMASFVRMHGPSCDLHGYQDASAVNQWGQPAFPQTFTRDCVFHKGVLKDNDDLTAAMAKHFSKFDDMCGYQIYNEPGYDWRGFFDYHPAAIEAYRKWLVEKEIMTEEEAAEYTPPKRRPYYNEDPKEWANFRDFSTHAMSNFLCHLGDVAKENDPSSESFSCPTPGALVQEPQVGNDFFELAEKMDILGFTHYRPFRGDKYYTASMILDAAESAAAAFGKHAWIIEYDCKTLMPVIDYERETYGAVGAGIKAINYYLYRSDIGGFEGELGGMMYSNRTRTQKYDGAVKMNQLINRLSEKLVTCEKMRDGIGVLYSTYANNYHDATDIPWRNRVSDLYTAFYKNVKNLGFTCDYTRASELERNPLGIKLLLVPDFNALTPEESAQVAEFAKTHLVVDGEYFAHPDTPEFYNGFRTKTDFALRPDNDQRWAFRLEELVDMIGAQPHFVISGTNNLGFGYLENDKGDKPYYVVNLINIDSLDRTVSGATLELSDSISDTVSGAIFYTKDQEIKLDIKIKDGCRYVDIPDITGGGAFIIIE